MNTLFLVLFFIFLILLIVIMFLLLKRLIFKVNQQSMDYFVDKLKAYDKLVDEREKKLEELNKRIDNKTEELDKKEKENDIESQPIFLYDLQNVTYKDDEILQKMKDIDKKFDFNNRKIVEDFVNNVFDDQDIKDYDTYCEIRKKFEQEVIFHLLTLKKTKQMEEVKELLGEQVGILDDFIKNNKEYDLKKFISYLNKVIDHLDPYIYVYVGDQKENYNDLNEYIKTEVDDSIFKGIKIIYRGKLYDYSI